MAGANSSDNPATEAELPEDELPDPIPPDSAAEQHRRAAGGEPGVRFAVLTVSDTRTRQNDRSGDVLQSLLESEGHVCVGRQIVRDEAELISAATLECCQRSDVQAVLLTGGTGIAPRDCTPEAVVPLLDVELPGFGELFRRLSFEEIGSAAMLSRAFAGRRAAVVIVGLPGSTNAVRLAVEQLLGPELKHLVYLCQG